MIEKIVKINNFAVFDNFTWDNTVLDKENKIFNFRKLNILYGRNYSGKTTLSRIFRSFEINVKPLRYDDSEYVLLHDDGTQYDEENLINTNTLFRVYNKDFVRDNLKFLLDEDAGIIPFAIMGKDNVLIEKNIKDIEIELGSVEKKCGLLFDQKNKEEKYKELSNRKESKNEELKNKLRNKAKSIKENIVRYKNVNYRITNIETDIQNIEDNKLQLLSSNKVAELEKLISDTERKTIIEFKNDYSFLKNITKNSKLIVEKTIEPTIPIRELLDNSDLQTWVKNGILLHKDKRERCGFCNQILPIDLWKKFDSHFNKDSENLRSEISNYISTINQAIEKINNIDLIEKENIYTVYLSEYDNLKILWSEQVKKCCSEFKKIIEQLENKQTNVFSKMKFNDISDETDKLVLLEKEFNELIKKNNKKTETLTEDKENAKNDLRLNEINNFLSEIAYAQEIQNIEKLKGEVEKSYSMVQAINLLISEKNTEIQKLKNKMKDEKIGAENVNEYLNNFFGNDSLKLEHEEDQDVSKFTITRGGEAAFNLSEGECSLIAFCYFMAKLNDVSTQGKKTIIWIDDPISSLDNSHVFFIYSLIESQIAIKKEYEQLFVSTHNLDFLKYLKKMTLPTKSFLTRNQTTQTEPDVGYFLIERVNNISTIKVMPKYLRQYTTEFNYLFDQIHKCSEIVSTDVDYECCYNFGNNLRKFLEAYLFYKYPNNTSITVKLRKFCKGDNSAVALINRVDNELSHLEEIFDRSIRPIDIPEIPKLAKYVLSKIENNDPDQYEALLKSIRGQ